MSERLQLRGLFRGLLLFGGGPSADGRAVFVETRLQQLSFYTRRGRSGAGQMVAVDTHAGRLYHHEELVDALAAQHPYEAWLENVIELDQR